MYCLIIQACGGGASGPITPPVGAIELCEEDGYYVHATEGNDTNSGTSSCEPWQSFERASLASLEDGDSLLLRRGETWYEQLTISTSGLTVGAYGEGVAPIIDGSAPISSWNSEGGNLFSHVANLETNQALGNIATQSGEILTHISWNSDQQTTFANAPLESFSFDFTTNTVFVKTATDPNNESYRASVRLYGIDVEDGLEDINISGVLIQNFSLHGIELTNCNDCGVHDVIVQNGGGAVLSILGTSNNNYLYAGNGVEFNQSSNHIELSETQISDIFDSCASSQTFASSQVGTSHTYHDLMLNRCGFSGIEISVLNNNGTTNSTLSNITISEISASEMGQGWSGRRYGSEGHGLRIVADVGAGDISDILVTDSHISNNAGDGVFLSGLQQTVELARVRINNNAENGIRLVDTNDNNQTNLRISSSLITENMEDGVHYNCSGCDELSILQNTFYENTQIDVALYSLPSSLELVNNILYSQQNNALLFTSSPVSDGRLDYNCYLSKVNMIGYGNDAFFSLDVFFQATGFETNGVDVSTSPFNATTDFTLNENSPCFAAGDPGLGIEFDLNARAFSTPPNTGSVAQ